MENKKDLTITRIFDAPVKKNWDAWTQPKLVKKWWGPKNFSAPFAEIDFKVGGKYLFCMHGSPGSGMAEADFWSTGVYHKIVPMEEIVVKDSFADEKGNIVSAAYYGMLETFPLELTISIFFEDDGNSKTKMVLYYSSIEGIEGVMLDNMIKGWNQSFDKLEEIL